MSSSYATTYSILPVVVSGDEVTIATCEPFQTGWEREIEQITKKSVKRVVSNPLDIARYTTEFYKLAQQVKGAAKAGATPLVSSFEQLVSLGMADRQAPQDDPVRAVLNEQARRLEGE
jgi:general secretion pathway protein E